MYSPPRVDSVGNGDKIRVLGRGKIEIQASIDGEYVLGVFTDVLYVPVRPGHKQLGLARQA